MAIVTKILDSIWSLKFFKGFRTQIARAAIIGMSGWQYIATNQDIIQAGVDLPDIPEAWLTGLTAYFALQIAKFAKEHEA